MEGVLTLVGVGTVMGGSDVDEGLISGDSTLVVMILLVSRQLSYIPDADLEARGCRALAWVPMGQSGVWVMVTVFIFYCYVTDHHGAT